MTILESAEHLRAKQVPAEVLDLLREGIKHASRAGTIGGQEWATRAREYIAAQVRQEEGK